MFDTDVKVAIYTHIADTTAAPTPAQVAATVGASEREVKAAYQRLYQQRVLVLEPDGESIRMAPPFSGVPTQHRVRVGDKEYFANCAWDALGIPAALQQPGEVFSRCVIHFAVPAALWWKDIVYT